MVKVSENLKKLAKYLNNSLYIVGGYVRNSLLGYAVSDIDLAAKHTPQEVFELLKDTEFSVHYTSEKLLTLAIRCGEERYEYTTFRHDSYSLGHTPNSVAATEDINIDAFRRDFTVNAIYYDIALGKIIDPTKGRTHLEKRILATTRRGEEVFCEDGLRLMRLARQSAELGFGIEESTLSAAKQFAYKITEISAERIREELSSILVADTKYGVKDAQVVGLKILTDIGVLQYIMPELTLGIGMEQRKDFHKYDVFMHTLNTVKHAPADIRLAALLHDIGKPQCYKKNGRYLGHDVAGEKITHDILTRLKYPQKAIDETKKLVLAHMFDLKMDAKENTVRLFVQKNFDIMDKLYQLKQADFLGGGLQQGISPSAQRLMDTYQSMIAQKVPFRYKDLLVGGKELIALGIPKEQRNDALKELLKSCALAESKLITYEQQLNFLTKYTK